MKMEAAIAASKAALNNVIVLESFKISSFC